MAQAQGAPEYPVLLTISQDGAQGGTAWSLTQGYVILSEGNSVSAESAEASAAASVLYLGNRTRIHSNSETLRSRLVYQGTDNAGTPQEYSLLQSGIKRFALENNVNQFLRHRYAEVNKTVPVIRKPKSSTRGMTKYTSLPRLTIATDASMSSPTADIAGIAWLAEDGRHGTKVVSIGGSGILIAELWAIHEIFGSIHKGQKVYVQSDSQAAIHAFNTRKEILAKSDKHSARKVEVLEAIDREMAGRDVTIGWVKGHNGHPMNETADKIARFSRRCHERGDDSLDRWKTVSRLLLEGIGYDKESGTFVGDEQLKAS